MQYRKEIDGLRALAVLPVILFHANFTIFSGGFVGVDIFFVISGYLITSIILEQMQAGTFTIAHFYERRARRILPALFIVMVACIPFAAAWMLPSQFKEFWHSLVAVNLFVSNIFFWKIGGYFETATTLKPLLHTWSLAVEEQYYVFFPIGILLFWRFGKRFLFWLLVLGAILSFALSEYIARRYIGVNFYLLPSRAWEILAGALVAFILQKREQFDAPAFSLAGLAMILASVFVYDETLPWPSFYALLPVVGTLLIILCTREAHLSYKILASSPLVLVGLISYSAYLWHQPLFAFARIRSFDVPSPALMLGLSAASLVLGWLSWKYVETPFRKRRADGSPLPKKLLTAFGVIGVLAVAFLAMSIIKNAHDPNYDLTREITDGKCNYDRGNCYEVAEPKQKVALWGDSYADAIITAVAEKLNAEQISLYGFIKHSCPSILGTERNQDEEMGTQFRGDCRAHNEAALAAIETLGVDAVILTSAYTVYLAQTNTKGEPILIDPTATAQDARTIYRRLGETIRALNAAGIKVILITPHPDAPDFADEIKKIKFRISDGFALDTKTAREANDLIRSTLTSMGARYTEENGMGWFCDAGGEECSIIAPDGEYLLFDGTHVSASFARTLADDLAAQITPP